MWLTMREGATLALTISSTALLVRMSSASAEDFSLAGADASGTPARGGAAASGGAVAGGAGRVSGSCVPMLMDTLSGRFELKFVNIHFAATSIRMMAATRGRRPGFFAVGAGGAGGGGGAITAEGMNTPESDRCFNSANAACM